MKNFLLLLMGCVALWASAQQVTVVERTRLLQGVEGPAYHPVLSADGSRLLFASGEQYGLKMYSYDDNADDISIGNVLRQSIELIARMPTIAVTAYQVKRRVYDHKSMY